MTKQIWFKMALFVFQDKYYKIKIVISIVVIDWELIIRIRHVVYYYNDFVSYL